MLRFKASYIHTFAKSFLQNYTTHFRFSVGAKKHFSYDQLVSDIQVRNCLGDFPTTCWMYLACNEFGWFQTFGDRYPSLKKYLSLKQFSQVCIKGSHKIQ